MKHAFFVLMILVVVANGQTANKTTNDVKIRQAMSAGGGNRIGHLQQSVQQRCHPETIP